MRETVAAAQHCPPVVRRGGRHRYVLFVGTKGEKCLSFLSALNTFLKVLGRCEGAFIAFSFTL